MPDPGHLASPSFSTVASLEDPEGVLETSAAAKRMAPKKKLKNRSLTREDVAALAGSENRKSAAAAAKFALQDWYSRCYDQAHAIIPRMQIESNLEKVTTIPGWTEEKGLKNGYVMLRNMVSGEPRPMIVALDYTKHPAGGVTGRQLHKQVRQKLQLEAKYSLRIIPDRPWYYHITTRCPIPEEMAIPASEKQYTHLLGTTLLYFSYDHLHDHEVLYSIPEHRRRF